MGATTFRPRHRWSGVQQITATYLARLQLATNLGELYPQVLFSILCLCHFGLAWQAEPAAKRV